jgi:hypothetical protein
MDLRDIEIETRLAQHAAFWRRGAVDAPLISRGGLARRSRLGVLCGPDWPQEGRLTPEMLSPERIARRAARVMTHDGIILGDAFALSQLSSTIPWLEAMIGCPIFYSLPNDTVWAETLADPALPLNPGVMALERNPWLAKLVEIMQAFSATCANQLPVATLHLRGASDLLGAYLGPSRMCLAAYDAPGDLGASVAVAADLIAEVIKHQNRAIAPFRGGYFSGFELWAPGATVIWSQDLATLFSPAMYRRLFLEFDRRVAALTDWPLLHVHTSEAHCYPLWAEIPGLCIEITVDPTGSTLAQLLPQIAALARDHPLMLQVQNERELALAIGMLPAQGLFVQSRRPGGRPPVASDLELLGE